MKSKSNRVELEQARLFALFEGANDSERQFIDAPVKQLAWLNVSIADLQRAIDKAGSTVEYQNGENQYGTRKNPDIDTLVSYQKQVNAIVKTIAPYMHAEMQNGSKLLEFLN